MTKKHDKSRGKKEVIQVSDEDEEEEAADPEPKWQMPKKV